MKSNVFNLIPFFYFIKTRVPSLRSFVFHLYYEWIPALIVTTLYYRSFSAGVLNFLIYYFIFISIYELGYLLNDHYSVKKEEAPRMRSQPMTQLEIAVFVVIRLTVFVLLGCYKEVWLNREFVFFYSALSIIFLVHNFLEKKEYKVVTFLNLATFRFLAPFLFVIGTSSVANMLPSILLNYVFYRTISYMESKSLVAFEGRKEARFKLSFYSLLIPLSCFLSILFRNFLPLIMNAYYLFFWVAFWIVENREKKRAIINQ